MSSTKNLIENVLDDNIIGAKETITDILYSKMSGILEKKERDFVSTFFNSELNEKKREYSTRETIYGMPKDEYMKLTDEMKRKVKEKFYFEKERQKKAKEKKTHRRRVSR
jgi:hypothetical protein